MTARAATLEADGLLDGPAKLQPEGSPAAALPVRGASPKFLYASGSRPLEGFTIKRGIGRGGFGEVYFATSDAGKELALKHIERNLEVELRGVSQCLNLKHANLIDLYDIRYDEQGDAWVVMEYVAGSSLKDTIDRNPNGLPLDLVIHWFRGIAAGTAYLHDHGIVHRDLKPGNIFEDAGRVKIGDYGLSKFISTSRRSGQTESVGTFHYMAPEIGKGVYGKEIDIYALGIILFEMLTGRVPFDGESSQEIIMKHLTAEPDLSGVLQPYRGIIEKALQKDPAKRYACVGEMLAALDAKTDPLAGSKPASGSASNDLVPKLFGASPLIADPPYYIGDENEGIELGPLKVDADKLAKMAPARTAGTPFRSPHAVAEPVAAHARQSWQRTRRWWNAGTAATTLKLLLLAVVALIAGREGGWVLAVAVALGCIYLMYHGIRLLAGALRSRREQAIAVDRPNLALLREKTAGDRVGELTGSMLLAAAIAGVLAVVMTALGGESLDNSAEPLAGPVWLWLATTLGAWLVLGAGKFCEGRDAGEPLKRRFAMFVAGLAFGALAFVLSQFLMVKISDAAGSDSGLIEGLVGRDGAPRFALFATYFAALFATLGWWKQTDPLRASRLRIGPILVAVAAAWLWYLLLPFPQPWGFMVIAGIAITSQLAAPWLSPAARAAARARTH